MKKIALLSVVQSATPSEFSLKGKCLGLRMRVPPSAKSAKNEVCFPALFRKASFLPSAVMVRPPMQNPDQLVRRVGSPIGVPVCASSGISQKLQALPKKDSGSATEYRSRPSANQNRSFTFFISVGPNKAVGGPLFRSRLRRVSPDWSVLMYRTRFASPDQLSPPMELSSSVSKSFRACSPLGSISQISRSPSLPLFVPKPIKEPSGETEYATALSRIFCGGPPRTEHIQMLEPSEFQD